MLTASFSSSALSHARYEPSTLGLHIVFTSGKGYDFCRVPLGVWEGLCSAGSAGTYYNDVIRDHYQC